MTRLSCWLTSALPAIVEGSRMRPILPSDVNRRRRLLLLAKRTVDRCRQIGGLTLADRARCAAAILRRADAAIVSLPGLESRVIETTSCRGLTAFRNSIWSQSRRHFQREKVLSLPCSRALTNSDKVHPTVGLTPDSVGQPMSPCGRHTDRGTWIVLRERGRDIVPNGVSVPRVATVLAASTLPSSALQAPAFGPQRLPSSCLRSQ